MTSDQQNQFEAEWPALALRLQAMLRRKRVSDWMVDDLVQETGCRLIRMWSQVDRTKPVWPLVATIGLNLLRDEMRRGSWSELTGVVPDSPSKENVEARGLARLELRQVSGALSRLNDSQRNVLLAVMTDAPSEGADPSAMRMLRMRARRRLHQLMDQASVLGVTVGFQARRVMREAEVIITKALPLDADRLPSAVLSVAAALSIGLAALPGDLVDRSWGQGGPGRALSEGRFTFGDAAGAGLSSRGASPASASAHRAGGSRRGSSSESSERPGSSDRGSSDDEEDTGGGTAYYVPIAEGTYVAGSARIQLEGFEEQGRDVPSGGTGSLSCSTSPDTGASCTHGGDGWEQRSVRIKQHTEVWVQGERVY